ncbi:phospholipase D-like domain-containing protein [Avibacterium volantium]|uniref:phospholipase D-like domain-containing protein n=1 Tax=Avibacterium TaxID=292486 RepID=UPI0039FC8EA1
MSELSPCRITLSIDARQVNAADNWFLKEPQDAQAIPVDATIQPLINGQEAFECLFQRINAAKHSVEIAIWGFQPSMFFQRDGTSPCIGDLLIQKALDNVKVKVLVWSMKKYFQTFSDANLGNLPYLAPIQKKGEPEVTEAQKYYDFYWYMAVQGNGIQRPATIPDYFRQAYDNLEQFCREKKYAYLQYKNRLVRQASSIKYLDEALSPPTKIALSFFPSHHQKQVLIDYEHPTQAVGFVLEHNMVDNYWDTHTHQFMRATATPDPAYEYPPLDAPNLGKNVQTPLQDVSALVTGQVLWNLNENFLQSWNRNQDNFTLNYYNNARSEQSQQVDEATLATFTREKTLVAKDFPCRSELGAKVKAQILRTYDTPKVEDIKQMYLQNIKKATSYIYTENQYFRFPPLVDSFIEMWRKQKQDGRTPQHPIHWFVVTNSTKAGLGSGMESTQRMFQYLGRGEQLPKMMKVFGEVSEKDIKQAYQKELARQRRLDTTKQCLLEKNYTNSQQYKADEIRFFRLHQQQQAQQAQDDAMTAEQAYEQFAAEVGIKTHICTLVAMNSNPKQWQEVYVHSKVTLINDVFLCISSANLNTRSMQVDTELGIITECRAVATQLRTALWAMHTGGEPEANPADLVHYRDAAKAYKKWGSMLDTNQKLEQEEQLPEYPLRRFLNTQFSLWSFD